MTCLFWITGLFLAGALLSVADVNAQQVGSPAIMLAQAGSTGGNVGNRDKSISGSDSPPSAPASPQRHIPPVSHAPEPAPTGCSAMMGRWSWNNGGGDTEINPGGTLSRNGQAGAGSWSCNDGVIVLVWSVGWVDKLTLSSDGKRLSGNNQFGIPVSGDR
jgi:hypothetical protein